MTVLGAPVRAIAWQFRRRHRWGLAGLGCYLVALALVKLVVVATGGRVVLDNLWAFAFAVVVPIAATFTYFLAVFTFGLEGDLAARQSMFPPRMFTLPISTSALAGWPMLFGSAAIMVLWAALRVFAIWPAGETIPVLWPALLAASLLAWTQALTWMPYGLRGMRIVVAMLWLATIDAIVMLALQFKAPETVMLAMLAPHVPLAFVVARYGVARARRGDVPDWGGPFVWAAASAAKRRSRLPRFATPEQAQALFEWKERGWSLPALVVMLVPLELTLLAVAGSSELLVFTILFAVLCTPPFMATFVGATGSASPSSANRAASAPAFHATRPLTSTALVAAKLKTACGSALAASALTLVAIPVALALSGTAPMVIERVRTLAAFGGIPRAITWGCLGTLALLVATWKQLVNGLFIGLSGRDWMVKANVVLALTLLTAIGPVVQWLADHRGAQVALWGAIPAVLALCVVGKLSAACWVAVRLARSNFISDRALVLGTASWTATVLALYGLLAWLFYFPLFPRYLLGLAAILAVPLARLAAAPLALDWNRHR